MADDAAPKIDFNEHQKTFDGFIRLSKVAIIATFNILVCLILFVYGGGLGTFFGTVLMVATLIAVAIGMFGGQRGWIPLGVVFVLSLLAWVFSIA